jgi:hypothetical protein
VLLTLYDCASCSWAPCKSTWRCREEFEALRASNTIPPAKLLAFPQLLCTPCDKEQDDEDLDAQHHAPSQDSPESPRMSNRSSNGWGDGKKIGSYGVEDSRSVVPGPTEGRPGRLQAAGAGTNHGPPEDMRTSLLVPTNRSSSGISDDAAQSHTSGVWAARKGRSSTDQVWRRGPAAESAFSRPSRSGGQTTRARCASSLPNLLV